MNELGLQVQGGENAWIRKHLYPSVVPVLLNSTIHVDVLQLLQMWWNDEIQQVEQWLQRKKGKLRKVLLVCQVDNYLFRIDFLKPNDPKPQSVELTLNPLFLKR